jgi:hypothetical protein
MSAGRNKSRSNSSAVDMTPQSFSDLQSPFARVLQGVFTNGFDMPKGPYTAPATGAERGLTGQLINTPNTSGTAERFLDKTMAGGVKNPLASNPFGKSVNPFLTKTIRAAQRPGLQGLEETLGRTLPGRFTQAGQFTQPQGSSAFDRAAAIATRGVADANADIATGIGAAAFEGERGRQLQQNVASADFENNEANRGVQAAELQQGITNSEISNMTTKLQAAALPRLIEQYGIDKGLELFESQMDAMLAALGVAAGVTRPVIATTGDSKSSGGSVGLK